MSSCHLIVTVLMKFPLPPKSYAKIFFRGAQDLVLVQLTLIMQKIIKKTLMWAFLGKPQQPYTEHRALTATTTTQTHITSKTTTTSSGIKNETVEDTTTNIITTNIDEDEGDDCRGGKRVRRNVKSLGRGERQSLVRAMEALIASGTRYQDLANFHGGPVNAVCPESAGGMCCPHGDPAFLPWHRLFMAQMEDELGEALPYWDWTEDREIPDLWEEIRAPIKEGESSECEGGQFVTRFHNVQLNTTQLKRQVQDALDHDDFIEFEDALGKGPHGTVHVGVDCDMFNIATAGYDTVFYLHHSYVDYLWAFWQELRRLRGHSLPPRFEGVDEPLPPFNNRRFNENDKTFQNSRAQDTMDYQNKLCYEYDQLLFDNLTPAQFLEAHQRHPLVITESSSEVLPEKGRCGPVCRDIEGKEHCEEICSSVEREGGFARVSVGVVLPRDAPTGINTIELCQERSLSLSLSLSFIRMANVSKRPEWGLLGPPIIRNHLP